MLEMWYESGSTDKIFFFRADNNLINKSDIRDYGWEYAEQFQKVKQFNKSLSTRSIPITFFQRRSGANKELYLRPTDMYEIFDRDVRMNAQGKLCIGKFDQDLDKRRRQSYYINCYIIGSKKTEYDNEVVIKTTLTVLSDFSWHKEMVQTFGGNSETQDGFLDYEYGYPYDYGTSSNMTNINMFQNEAIAPFDFRIEFYGQVDTPMVKVGGQIYRVYTSLDDGEILVVDSLEKRVYRIHENGSITNEFNARDRENYIFQKMPINEKESEVEWQEGKLVTIKAYIERSEPLWI